MLAVALGAMLLSPLAGAQTLDELESRLRSVTGTDEEAGALWALANSYLARNDTIRAAYVLERLHDMPVWAELPIRREVLTQWALMEESRSRYARSAEMRGELVTLDREEGLAPHVSQALTNTLLWSDALSRAGRARKAADVLWEIIRADPAVSGRLALHRLMEALRYADLNSGELAELAEIVRKEATLAYQLYQIFDLCVERERYEEASTILDYLIKGNPWQLVTRVKSILLLPDRDLRISQLESLIDARNPREDVVIAMRIQLYDGLGQSEEAMRLAQEVADERLTRPASESPPITIYLAEMLYSVFLEAEQDELAARLESRMVEQAQLHSVWLQRYTQRLAAQGESEAVVAAWQSYIDANPGHTHRWTEAGRALNALGLRQEAMPFLQLGQQVAPNYDATQALADAHLDDGNISQALDLFDQLRAQRMTDGDWLASHIAGRLGSEEDRQTLLGELNRRLRSGQMPDWQLLLAVDLTAGAPDWEAFVDALRHDPSGRLVTLCVGRLLVLDRPELVEQCLPPPEAAGSATAGATPSAASSSLTGWAPGVRYELAQLFAQTGLERRPDGERLVSSLAASIPWSATQPLGYTERSQVERRVAKLWLQGLVAAGKLSQAYAIVSDVSADITATKIPEWGLSEARELMIICANVQARAADLDGALNTIEAWRVYDDPPELRWLEALAYLWREEPQDALERLEMLVEEHSGAPAANDAIELLHLLDSLDSQNARTLGHGLYLEMQGRYRDADGPYRDLAIAARGTPAADWARKRLARLAWRDGRVSDARGEWERFLPETALKSTQMEGKWFLAAHGELRDTDTQRQVWEEIVLDGADSLITDMVRWRLDHMP